MNRNQDSVRSLSTDEAQVANANDPGESQASFMERVGASASGLMQSSWGCPPPSMITNDLVSMHASASKGDSSSRVLQGAAVSTAYASGVTQTRDSKTDRSASMESFRTQPLHSTLHVQQDFDQWSIPRTGNLLENVITGYNMPNTSECHPAKHKGKELANPGAENVPIWQSADNTIVDGAAVASLLSNPVLNIDDVPSSTWESGTPGQALQVPHAEQMLLDHGINPKNLSASQLASFKEQSPAVQQKSIQINVQNMVKPLSKTTELEKTYDQFQMQSMLGQQSNKKRMRKQYGLVPNFGASEPSSIGINFESQPDDFMTWLSSSDEGVKPWLHILDRYHDEVWSDLLPLVQEAREEVKAAKESNSKAESLQDGPAVRRLKMVLQHLDPLR